MSAYFGWIGVLLNLGSIYSQAARVRRMGPEGVSLGTWGSVLYQ